MSSFLSVILSVVLFGGLHSLLASRQAKDFSARRFGVRQQRAFYRIFYIGQSFVALAVLWAPIRRLPDRVLYRIRGPLAALLRLGQLAGFGYAVYAAATVGMGRITGLASLLAWLRGERVIPPVPEAQGPAPHPRRPGLNTGGPFRFHRHPLNFAPLPIFWLNPLMTLKLLAFNLAATVYLVLGSIHEESRLLAAYGKAYRRYQNSQAPFYMPSTGKE